MGDVDDEAVRRCKNVVGTQAVLIGSGELKIPLQSGVIEDSAFFAFLSEFCTEEKNWRANSDHIPFKSVGQAIKDLAAAMLIYQSA
jgi:ornithine cyclodeaminase/alanine dehydrogenase-like protein (mu-crystallin family)